MKFRHFARTLNRLLFAFAATLALVTSGWAEAPPQEIDFARDIRPILAANCFHCHGTDPDSRQADLRLDVWQKAGEIRGAEDVITTATPDESAFVARITSSDADLRMPPPDSGKTLKPEQIETLRRWIAAGAPYEQHWAFVAPQRPSVPQVSNSQWIRNPIDSFILARLEKEGLHPSPQADAATLLRRLSLDLTGLPPTIEEAAAFEANTAADAYAQQVERLLDSPHFGERWGRIWLDAARYADSDGFEKDKPRLVWMYRDWVINALNRDMPYDEFVVQQIAGDLLPQPTQDQLVATGFLRNSMINEEGGIDPEQFRMEAMFDRMDAIGKAVLGVTIQCAQCHSHKYDPITQADYYRMFAFLNNCHEAQAAVYTSKEQDEWQATEALIHRLENGLREENPDWPERMAAWEESVRNDQPEWIVVTPQLDASGGQKHYVLEDGSILAAGYAPTKHTTDFSVEIKLPKITAIRLELLNDPDLPRGGPGRSPFGTCALSEFQVDATPLEQDGKPQRLKFSQATADVNPPEKNLDKAFDDRNTQRRVTGPIAYANDGNNLTAWGVDDGPGRCNVPRKAVFVLEKPLEAATGVTLDFHLVQQHGGWNSDDNQNNNLGRFRFSVTTADNVKADPLPTAVREVLKVPASERTAAQTDTLFSYWRTTVPEWEDENRRIDALWQSHPQGTTQLVLQERQKPRQTHRLNRGNFLTPAEVATPGVPDFLHPLTETTAPTRLTFARWLADRRSPTTARAIVNRIWQAYFGTGLVSTPEDLGTQGDIPSHPELLDWLACELMEHSWSLKHLHRRIVMSATYQQSSAVTPELLSRDPDNRLLARGPRYRVDAEIVRDVALAASGLLNDKIGGPSVHPPAPAFLFVPPASYGPKQWHVDMGPDRYRRGLYTFRFRSVPYPVLQNFDAPIGEIACARRSRSNTPLQALTTLNEPLFLECARALAMDIMNSGGANDQDRLTYAVRRCLSRGPEAAELRVLQSFLTQQKERFHAEGVDPWPLLIDDEKSKEQIASQLAKNEDAGNLAAWTALARVVLNLDEMITKE